MCLCLNIARSTYYYEITKQFTENSKVLNYEVISAFNSSKGVYGARKIKIVLQAKEIKISRKRIRKIMIAENLVSVYTKASYKVHKPKVNEDGIGNVLNRDFDNRKQYEVIVSDLTYARVQSSWNYICVLLDLSDRSIKAYNVGRKKDANFVYETFMKSNISLKDIKLFHTDRGNEFKNKTIEELLETFNIERSLSNKGCPYDNSVAESLYKTIKTEFIRSRVFDSLEQLEMELFDYVNWYNNFRIHGSLDYKSPNQYRLAMSM